MKRYEGQVCLVTAATEGIGFAIAQRMAEEGATVHICSRKKANVDRALEELKGLNVIGHVCNVGSAKARQEMLSKISAQHNGRLDVLVPNAACSTHFGANMGISESAYDKMFDLNVKSTFFLIKECHPMLEASAAQGGHANICVVSSYVGRNPNMALGVYSMTKAALDNMIVSLCAEFRPDGIRVTGVAPGLVKTKLAGPIFSKDIDPTSYALPPAIGSVVATICSKSDGSFMNGEIFHVNGGHPKI